MTGSSFDASGIGDSKLVDISELLNPGPQPQPQQPMPQPQQPISLFAR